MGRHRVPFANAGRHWVGRFGVLAMLVAGACVACADPQDVAPSPACNEFRRTVLAQLEQGRDSAPLVEEAARRLGPVCAGYTLVTLATVASLDGRVRDIERFAERSISFFEREYSPDNPVLLRPVAFVAVAAFQMNNLPKARRAFDRLRRIAAETPAHRALVHAIAATFLRGDGKVREAEAEIRAAISEHESAKGSSADLAWFLQQLSFLDFEQGHYAEARDNIVRAGALLAAAPDATPLDRIRVLEVAGIIEARQGDWPAAERALSEAVAIVDALPSMDPSAVRGVFADYAFVLRKVGRARDARDIEKRMASFPPDPARGMVDITQLEREGKLARK